MNEIPNEIDIKSQEELPLCGCGCGDRVSKPGNKFIIGHNAKIKPPRGMLGKVSPFKLERKPIICKQCGDVFYVLPKSERIFCSTECHYEWRSENINGEDAAHWKGGKITVLCDYCGNEIIDWESQLYSYNFCCKICHDKWQSKYKFGENNSNWKGGISFNPYCEKFNNIKKEEVRNEYNNCDYLTGIHRDICNKDKNGKIRELDVHHIDYNKMQGCNDREWKLIPVSRYHNLMFNSNRNFWERLIYYALEYDKDYYKENDFNLRLNHVI